MQIIPRRLNIHDMSPVISQGSAISALNIEMRETVSTGSFVPISLSPAPSSA